MIPAEEVVNRLPVTIRRRVKWGECDPAGVVYTPRFVDYVVEACLTFTELLVGAPLRQRLRELDLDLPAKAVAVEFSRGLWPEQLFDMVIEVGEIRTRTFDLRIRATTVEGDALFDARFSPICVRNGTREGCQIPERLRRELESYRLRCEQPRPEHQARPTATTVADTEPEKGRTS